MNTVLLQSLNQLPLFIDGSDGSLWPARADVVTVMQSPDSAARHFVRLDHLVAAISALTPDGANATLTAE